MLDTALCVALWLIVLLPGLLFAARHLRGLSAATRIFVGACASVGLLTYVAFIETLLAGVATVTPVLWTLLTGWALFENRDALRRSRLRQINETFARSPELQRLALLIAGSLFVRVIPLPFSLLPPGYDPTNHLLLAKLILTNNTIPTSWLPFEPVTLNYPVGLHNLLALLSKTSSLDLTLIWRSLYPLFGSLAVIAVYALARLVAARSSSAPLWIAGAYSVLVNMGSLEIYGWGGMVNLGALCFGVGTLLLATESTVVGAHTWAARVLGGLLFAAVCLSHHHVMLSTGATLIAVMVVSWLRWRSQLLHRSLFIALALGTALSSTYLVPFALKLTQLTQTQALSYLEPFYGPAQLVRSLGVIFPVAAILAARRFMALRAELAGCVLVTSFLLLFGIFVSLEYGYQGIHYLLTGQRIQPLVPARFLTHSVLFMAIPVGFFLERAFAWVRARQRALAAAFIVALAAQPAYHITQLCQNTTREEEYLALVWIRDNTPPDALIINDRGSRWVNYFCWRQTSFTPLPASEPAHRDPRSRIQTALDSGRPVFLMGFLPGLKPAFAAGPVSVYRVLR